jgi:hypothetical protein
VTLPPATSSVTPVIREELSEATKRVASATSSGVPSRLSGSPPLTEGEYATADQDERRPRRFETSLTARV